MKKFLIGIIAAAMTAALLAGCGSGGASGGGAETAAPAETAGPAETPAPETTAPAEPAPDGGASIAANEFTFDGHDVTVAVDISCGWSVEFGENATYIYDEPNDGEAEAAAFAVYMTQEEYETAIAEHSGDESYSEVGAGVMFALDDGTQCYAFVVGEGVNYEIMVEPGHDADEIYNRVNVMMAEVGAPITTPSAATAVQGAGASVATNQFIFDDQPVMVSVDIIGGWNVEFGQNATYIYDGQNDGVREAAGYAVHLTQEE
ncbi:MAG: hypothetical protein IJH73_05075, partial [Lachnospiraceae bacterium]|nr:hypothetical protein [Lachnospiraceae bacterium]